MSYRYFNQDYDTFLAHAEITKEDMKYGLPEKNAYPMPDRKHVMSAIKFFNYVSPKDEEALAKAILARMDEYGISEVNVGPDNRFGKYYEKTSLKHHGILGQRKGERRWQNPDGSWTPAGRERYGKGGKPRGDYNDEGKTAAKNLNRKINNAYFDGDNVRRVKSKDGRDMFVNASTGEVLGFDDPKNSILAPTGKSKITGVHLSGADFDGDVKKVIRLDKDNQGRSGMHLSGADFDGDVKKVIRLDKVDRQYKYDEKTREAMREARKDGYDSLTASQKKLLREVAYDMMDEN